MRKPKRHSLQEYLQGLEHKDIKLLSKTLTLLESDLKEDKELANELLKNVLNNTGNSIRVAITGSPGVGKSTFIETLGTALCITGKRVAVLTIDPSSQHSGGSILGDKTRMEQLSLHKNAFVRPSASHSMLGGTASTTRESILLCEAAGYEIILVETVGVGQSETLAAQMTDVFLVLVEPGAGDEVQAIKKGIIEDADIIAVTKADLDQTKAMGTAVAYLNEVQHSNWTQKELAISSLNKKDSHAVWGTINDFITYSQTNQLFQEKREQQRLFWLHEQLKRQLLEDFYTEKTIHNLLKEVETKIQEQQVTAYEAAKIVIDQYKNL